MKRNTYKKGDHLRVCDYCGFTYYFSQLKKDWKGLYACKDDFSRKHPQQFVRGVKDDPSVESARPRSDEFLDAFNYILQENGGYISLESNEGFLQQESAG